MKVTVILCTYNRCQTLGKALDSLAASSLPISVAWEVLVIDNNSNDRTREVVEGFCCRYPGRFRYIFEPQPGKSFALNRGIREACGDVLAFMDDDVTVEPTWLHNLTVSLKDGEWAGSGGRTLLAGAFSPPDWLTMEGPYSTGFAVAALFDLGPEPCKLGQPPLGANMAFRREMFEKYGLFRTDMGPSPNPKIPRTTEDAEFGRRLMAAGEKLRYEPSAVAYHPIHEHRVRKSYLLSWFFDCGRGLVRESEPGPDILGIPRRCFTFFRLIGTQLPGAVLLWILAPNPKGRFFRKCQTWLTFGQIVESYREWRSPRGQAGDPAGEEAENEDHRHHLHV